MVDHESELEWRLALWDELRDLINIEPGLLHDKRVYGGAQGIWVDKSRTGPLSANGLALSIRGGATQTICPTTVWSTITQAPLVRQDETLLRSKLRKMPRRRSYPSS
jgi:hypothetical protein